MPRSQDYLFVLWGERFEEATATIFVTELRRAGLRVKVVGLSQRQTAGMHGLALVPDLTLEEALPLARQTAGVIIPCQLPGLKRLENDPRLREFFHQAWANQATFIAGQDALQSGLLTSPPEKMLIYPGSEELVTFAQNLAHQFKYAHI